MAEHKHAEVLRAIADGKDVQWQSMSDGSWNDRRGIFNPIVDCHNNWRVKPEPKPDVVRYVAASSQWTGWTDIATAKQGSYGDAKNICKLTFEADTGKLKSVEIVE